VVAAIDFPAVGGMGLLAALRGRSDWAKIPVVALFDSASQEQNSAARAAGFQDCQEKFDGVRILQSVARLVSPLASVPATPVYLGKAR
jgi:CheY-like chemotaxis protein